ncbi:MAG TPA: response regulator transcription factor [Rhodanobacteraceae bacterium]|jgi:two-component system response regulator QseB|nr:response regulator transcription factor [Rhodanobacteraceae bacterium]
MHVLIVEDDAHLGRGLEVAIKRWGNTSEWVRDGATALTLAKTVPFDMLLLDLGLPQLGGLEVLKGLKRDGVSVPVIIITARDATDDRVQGLDLGADDYLTKPFELEELAARMRSVRRRVLKTDTSNLEVGRLAIDTLSREARFDGQLLALSRQEFLLLQTLAERAGRVVTRDFLERVLYGETGIDSNALEVHVHSLRKKTEPELIRTARGLGYLLTENIVS